MSHTFVLYHYWRSSSSWRVRWALHLKNIDYTSVPVNLLKKEHLEDSFLIKNPAGFVPCLEIDGQYFTESMAIIEWLEENYATKPLLPDAALEKLKVRQLYFTIVAGTQPLQNLSAQLYFSKDKEKRKTYAQHWISKGFDCYEKLLKHTAGAYSYKDQITMADLALVPQCYNAIRFDVDLGKYPLIKRTYEKCLISPECEKAAPHNQPGAICE